MGKSINDAAAVLGRMTDADFLARVAQVATKPRPTFGLLPLIHMSHLQGEGPTTYEHALQAVLGRCEKDQAFCVTSQGHL